MTITRHTMTIDNTTATTESSGSCNDRFTGTIYAIRSVYVDTMPTTNTVTLYCGSTERVIMSGITLSTNTWMYYPRVATVDSTGASTSWNTSTDMHKVPTMHCISTTEKITGIFVGSATCHATRDVEIFVEGN